ncbi:MAG: DUF1800 family protein [Akkermansiaceae bacterium]|nr:DUF1800 family protein [Akkermansiaceae bacterium]
MNRFHRFPTLSGVSIKRVMRLTAACCGCASPVFADLDADNNQLSDVWQKKHGVGNLAAGLDSDGDGFSNASECLFGTHPLRADSRPGLEFSMPDPATASANWPGEPGKRYEIQRTANLSQWLRHETITGTGKPISSEVPADPGVAMFLRIAVSDVDSDGDGLNDWEEIVSGFNPARKYTEGLGSTSTSNPITDYQRLNTALTATTNTLTVAAADPSMSEDWPDAGRFVIRRSGNLNEITVDFTLGGTANPGTDFVQPTPFVKIPFGKDEVEVQITPLADAESESPETITLTLLPGTGYTLGAPATATLNLNDAIPGKPSAKPAARFLTQCTFGPAPQELARVMDLGFSAWLDDQFLRGPNLHLPIVQTWQSELQTATFTNSPLVSSEHRIEAWWRQTMRSDIDSDPLRQRMAFALSQIFVISDRMDSLNTDQRGMTSYYDTLLTHSFGTYRGLLEAVTRHPWMGLYLSALRNRKPDINLNRFPDENYAREVMQLFSIGLWLLNPDGTQKLSNGTDLGPDGETIPAGEPIPTYGQDDVSEIARVFTGLSYGTRFTSSTNPAEIPTTAFSQSNNVPWQPMRMFDGEHDIAAKNIHLPGAPVLNLPARTGTTTTSQTGGDADLTAFLDYLATHPNTAPFISRLLIQRLVTSNPTPAYVARVSPVFTSSGGDFKQILRAILLDSEARDHSRLSDPAHGLVREPYTRYVAMARVFEAAPADPSAGGRYRGFGSLDGNFLQRPLSAPSVFNFYSPENKPPGPLRDNGLASPEMQIINSVSSITGPNVYSSQLRVTSTTLNTDTIPTNGGWTQLNTSQQNDNTATPENENFWNTRINEQPWLDLATTDPAALAPDAMVAKLDELLCYGNMGQPTFRAITRALNRQADPFSTADPLVRAQYIRARLRNAIHLITTSADYAVLK